jgi:hypothetical protein
MAGCSARSLSLRRAATAAPHSATATATAAPHSATATATATAAPHSALHDTEYRDKALQVRAWGLFLQDIFDRLAAVGFSDGRQVLVGLIPRCLSPNPSERPTFHAIHTLLKPHVM